jgi:hypothetical protein
VGWGMVGEGVRRATTHAADVRLTDTRSSATPTPAAVATTPECQRGGNDTCIRPRPPVWVTPLLERAQALVEPPSHLHNTSSAPNRTARHGGGDCLLSPSAFARRRTSPPAPAAQQRGVRQEYPHA